MSQNNTTSSTSFSEQDYTMMALAIKLAKKGQYTTTPNPNVGCVIVKDGAILGQGWHQKSGTGHAEVNALQALSIQQTAGATAYVTLEPCSHYGRTPPCALRLKEAKIKKVIVAMLDPNPLVAGNGVAILQEAGIEVQIGLLETDARALNPGFLSRMERQQPHVRLKLATSVDGKIALHNGESKWITGLAARADVQRYRALSCAILTTAKTVIRDNARLNVRPEQLNVQYEFTNIVTDIRQPMKIVLDGKNKITPEVASGLALFDNNMSANQSDNRLTTEDRPQVVLVKSEPHFEQATVDFKEFTNVTIVSSVYNKEKGFCVSDLISHCNQLSINNLWVEAGSQLSASFLQSQVVDELILYMAPIIMGKNAIDCIPLGPFDSMKETKSLNLLDYKMVGDDIRFTYQPINKH